jgi:ADP-ribose pyrophosphatase
MYISMCFHYCEEMAKDQFEHLKWDDIRRSRIARLGIFDIDVIRRRSTAGQTGRFVVVDTPDWVTIIPFVARAPDVVHTVRQFRHGSGQITVEFPAGVVNRGEDPAVAAERELLEETGCVAQKLIHIGAVNPNPAFMNNRIHTFVALGLEKTSGLALDDLELLELEQTALSDIYERAGSGEYDNGILMIALQWLGRWLGKQTLPTEGRNHEKEE